MKVSYTTEFMFITSVVCFLMNSSVSQPFFAPMEEDLKLFFISQGTLVYENENKTKRQMAVHGDSPVLLIARQKCPLGIFEIVCGMSEYLFIYSTVSCGTLVGKH